MATLLPLLRDGEITLVPDDDTIGGRRTPGVTGRRVTLDGRLHRARPVRGSGVVMTRVPALRKAAVLVVLLETPLPVEEQVGTRSHDRPRTLVKVRLEAGDMDALAGDRGF